MYIKKRGTKLTQNKDLEMNKETEEATEGLEWERGRKRHEKHHQFRGRVSTGLDDKGKKILDVK